MLVIEERQVCRMLEGLFHFDKECEWNDAIEEAMHRFINLPTIEAEPVIYCKNCKYCYIYSNGYNCLCDLENIMNNVYDFCSKAERRDDETD